MRRLSLTTLFAIQHFALIDQALCWRLIYFVFSFSLVRYFALLYAQCGLFLSLVIRGQFYESPPTARISGVAPQRSSTLAVFSGSSGGGHRCVFGCDDHYESHGGEIFLLDPI